jgi:lipoprotein-anchoring transpeptidase ErfK/SrfK
VATYGVAIGSPSHPTPPGDYGIRKIVWNPAWIPPDKAWARGKTAKDPGDPENPMRAVKLFFHEPDYFIHGTNSPGSIGEAASHGCLRMQADDAAELALMVMENGGVARDWDWVKNILSLGETRTVNLDVAAPLVID